MKRMVLAAMVATLLAGVPAHAQDKYVMGYGAGT
jgi:hypothetical protein